MAHQRIDVPGWRRRFAIQKLRRHHDVEALPRIEKHVLLLKARRCLLEGPIDGDSFRLYVEKVLLPTVRHGDIVVMDNLGSHRSKIVRQLIRSAGARLFFLPKYSPDLNPIEQVFAKLKHFLRKAAARTIETVCLAIGEVLQLFSPEESARYLANSGYGRT